MGVAIELIIGEFLFVAVCCGFLLRHYKSPLVTWDVACTVYLAWILGFAGVLLLPYDLSLAIVDDLQSATLVKIWSFVYWSTFPLAWFILPMQMEFHASGNFTVQEKLLDGLKKLAFNAVIAIVLGLIYVIYMVATSGLTFKEIISFTMAMSNTYGVLLITVLMGSGLVGIPKRLWNMADSEGELRRFYVSASTVEEAYQESRYELEDCEVEIRKAVELLEKSGPNSSVTKEVGPFILLLKEKAANFNFAGRAKTNNYIKSGASGTSPDYSEKKVLVALHARLLKCQLKARASERRWRVLVARCKQHQDAQKADLTDEDVEVGWCLMPVGGGSGGSVGSVSTCAGAIHSCLLACYRFWVHYCFRTVCRVAAIVLGGGSCLILWSEMVMASNLHSPIGSMMGAYQLSQAKPVIVQAISFLFLAYMSMCTYWTLFRMNISWAYRLQGPQLSPPSSLIFNGEYLARLQFAVGYNFLLCINISRTSDTAFRTLMENIEIIPVFGTSFTVYVPIIMIIIALITLFDGFGRMLALIGIDSEDSVYGGACCSWRRKSQGEDDMDASLLEKYNAGKQIIANEIRQLALANDSLAKARATLGGGRTLLGTSDTPDSSTHDAPREINPIIRNPILPSFSSKGGPKYSNLEMATPMQVVDIHDDDDLGPSIYSATSSAWRASLGNDSRHSTSFEDMDQYKPKDNRSSLFSKGSSTNSYENLDQPKAKDNRSSLFNKGSSVNSYENADQSKAKDNRSSLFSKGPSNPNDVAKKARGFNFDDDDDDTNMYPPKYKDDRSSLFSGAGSSGRGAAVNTSTSNSKTNRPGGTKARDFSFEDDDDSSAFRGRYSDL
eukprot:gene8285-9135_t